MYNEMPTMFSKAYHVKSMGNLWLHELPDIANTEEEFQPIKLDVAMNYKSFTPLNKIGETYKNKIIICNTDISWVLWEKLTMLYFGIYG